MEKSSLKNDLVPLLSAAIPFLAAVAAGICIVLIIYFPLEVLFVVLFLIWTQRNRGA